jgi:hypothetical protein
VRNSRDYDFRLDPPVNRRIPIARDRFETIRKIVNRRIPIARDRFETIRKILGV